MTMDDADTGVEELLGPGGRGTGPPWRRGGAAGGRGNGSDTEAGGVAFTGERRETGDKELLGPRGGPESGSNKRSRAGERRERGRKKGKGQRRRKRRGEIGEGLQAAAALGRRRKTRFNANESDL